MTYVGNRIIHDADSHLMELADCLDPFFDRKHLQQFHDYAGYKNHIGKTDWVDEARRIQANEAFRSTFSENIMLRKDREAHGAFIAADRPATLDELGFASQLVFTTLCLGNFGLDQSKEMDLCYAAASAHNRMMADFCTVDRRLLATAYIPLEDFERSSAITKQAIELGAKALMVPSRCPQNHSPSHQGLMPVWAMAAEAGIPVLFHVGGEEKLNPVYKENGLPPVPDFHGGDDNFTSVSYMPIPNAVMQTLATLIFDGIFDRFSNLKWGAIELGASWLPGWMRAMDSAAHAFMRNEERLQNLSDRPSEIVKRQLRVTPYPHEDTGWIIKNSSDEMCLFSSDFPHVEGGRNPLKRFDGSLEGCSDGQIERFYVDNFIDLMGKGLAPELHRPAHLKVA
ncbi:MAG: amidohydrolase family protein [Parvibaculum sp.]